MDKNLSNLLRWSIEHSTAKPTPDSGDGSSATAAASTLATATGDDATSSTAIKAIEAPPAVNESSTTAASTPDVAARTGTHGGLDPALISALLGGPSDADLMRAAIETINDPEATLENQLIAFDNFEQLIESIDNANNLEPLSLWAPLLKLLEHNKKEIRCMAAWSVGTAVQNNERSQERLLSNGGIPILVSMIAGGAEPDEVKKKVIYALSSACRNFQPSLNACIEEMVAKGIKPKKGETVDAADMEAVDFIIQLLREYKP